MCIPAPPDRTTIGHPKRIETAGRVWQKRIYEKRGNVVGAGRKRKVVIGDGADGSGILSAEHFPARSRLSISTMLPASVGGGAPAVPHEDVKPESLDEGPPEASCGQRENRKIGGVLRSIDTANPQKWPRRFAPRQTTRKKCGAYALSQVSPPALFVGSGVIEAACKTVIGSSSQTIGKFWTVRGANAILALRCFISTIALRTIGRTQGG